MFISFEGIDGCGKSTQVQMLCERLRAESKDVILIRDPGNNPISEAIRGLLLDKNNSAMTSRTELLLYSAARAQLVETAIRPALERGEIVLCDRFVDSTVVYQGFGRQLPLDDIERCTTVATNGVKPQLTFFLDISLAQSKARCEGKRLDRLETAGDEFFERVIAGYRTIAGSEPERFVRIDAARSVEEIHDDIWSRLCHHLLAAELV